MTQDQRLAEVILDDGPVLPDAPFHRRGGAKLTTSQFVEDLRQTIDGLELNTVDVNKLDKRALEGLVEVWKRRNEKSDAGFQSLLLVLEYCLCNVVEGHQHFEDLVSALGFHTVNFWKIVVPHIYDSDLSRGTKFRDALLFSLTLYDVNTGRSRLKELYAAVPGIRKSLLASEDDENSTSFQTGGLAVTHFHQRVINVSNAPPFSIKKEKSGQWEIKQGSGGLVACVDPVMSKDHENVWLANLGMNVSKKTPSVKGLGEEGPFLVPATNTLGIPLIKQTIGEVLFHVIADDDKPDKNKTQEQRKTRQNLLNPVVVQEEDYNVYYGGISNGLLWPVLHNLPEYIVNEYEDEQVLRDHWCSYVRVNYQFAIDAVRNSRAQDFIWIHDYHLMLTGLIMQGMDSTLEVGFFLHIPFQPPEEFFTKYGTVGLPIIRGLLRFTKVGFQTHRDRSKFVEVVEKYLRGAYVEYDKATDIFTAVHEGWSCSLGVFPVSIKNEDFLKFANLPETEKLRLKFREKILGKSPSEDGRFFFSVERFDYTKGIKEKLVAYERYFEKYPDRVGKDVLWQIAVTNRRSVDTYRVYQDECLDMADKINQRFSDPSNPAWKPLIFETDGLPREQLVAAYLAMDIGIVTPKKDGMNLVAKEMLVVNPNAGIILSSGAGSEVQFTTAGLYDEHGEKTYKRVADPYDVERYADAFYAAAIESKEERAQHGARLSEFVKANDIERWSTAFLDPSWTHQVIRPIHVETLDDFYSLMMRTRNIRRQIVERVLKGIPIKPHFGISLRNAKDSLEQSCIPNTKTLLLKSSPDSPEMAKFGIEDEVWEFEKDLSFISHLQSDDVDNVERFVDTLVAQHPISTEAFKEEVNRAVELLYDADHFQYFFTDRDGTLKSYSCSYPASIQPAYSGVIQSQFARRCAQTCAILTTAPLFHIGILDVSTIPEGYYYYGASAGREWFIDPGNKFKDNSIPAAHLEMLDRVFDGISSLLDKPEFKPFTWVGSGLQKHCGHITIALQDIYKSVNPNLSQKLASSVKTIVQAVDPEATTLFINQAELDLKICLRDNEDGRTFNKGDGVRLLCTTMKCDLKEGNILVCGDSDTDLPMLEHCLENAPSEHVYTIWVTVSETLKQKVSSLCDRYGNRNVAFVSCPEVLLGAMAQATILEIQVAHPRKFSQI
ncbi:unnamed protein product, partial [Mesorhabditis spiculigera]